MIVNFRTIEYLKSGNERQKLAFSEIKKHKVLEKLKKYNPILTGTIPIEIDVPESDLDIICECQNHSEFKAYLLDQFSQKKDFKVYSILQNEIESTIAEFCLRFLDKIFLPRGKMHIDI